MRYKQNLHIEDNKVISYTTHVATIDREAGKLYVHGWWSVTTSKHVNHVARELGLEIDKSVKTDTIRGFFEPAQADPELKTIAMVAKMGAIFGKNQKESNDWKAQMLKAGLENRGLIMPDDWNQLSEAEKQRRLDDAIAELA